MTAPTGSTQRSLKRWLELRDVQFGLIALLCGAGVFVLAAPATAGLGPGGPELLPALGPYLAALGAGLSWASGGRVRTLALAALAAAAGFGVLLALLPASTSAWARWALPPWPGTAIAALALAGAIAWAVPSHRARWMHVAFMLLLVPPLLLILGYAVVLGGIGAGLIDLGVQAFSAAGLAIVGLASAGASIASALWRRYKTPRGSESSDDDIAFALTLLVALGAPIAAASGAVLGGSAAARQAMDLELLRQRDHLVAHARAFEAELEREGVRGLVLGPAGDVVEAAVHGTRLYWADGQWWLQRGSAAPRPSGGAAALFEVAHATDTALWLCQADGDAQRCWAQGTGAPQLVRVATALPASVSAAMTVATLPAAGLTAIKLRSLWSVPQGALRALRAIIAPTLAFSLAGMLLATAVAVPLIRRLDRLRRNLAVLLEHVPAAVVTTDVRGRVVAANRAAHELLGLGMSDHPAPGSPLDLILAAVGPAAAADTPGQRPVALSWTAAGAQQVDVEVTAHAVPGETEASRLLMVHDVTRRNAAEAELLRAAQWRDAVLRAAGEGICVVNCAGELVLANPAARAILELEPTPVPTVEAPLSVPAPLAASWEAMVRDALGRAEPARGELALTRTDGTNRSIEYVTAPFRASLDGLVVVLRDVTEQRRTTEALAFTSALLRHTEEIGQIGSWHVDLRTGKNTWSEGKFRIHGLPLDTPVSADLHWQHVHPDDRDPLQRLVEDVVARQIPHEVRYRIVVNGRVKWVQGRGSFSFDAQGSASAWSGSIQDITDLQQRERELLVSRRRVRELAARREREREDERARLAREVHDELGQQLTALRLAVRRLEVHCANTQRPVLDTLDEVKQQIDQTSSVVRAMVQNLRPAVLDFGLAAAVEWLASDFGARHGVAVVLRNEIGDTLVEADVSTAIFRSLQEALTNVARHATAASVAVRLALDDGFVLLEVEDDGVGFDPQLVRAQRTFGLMGMRERALALGGSLRVNSRPGSGTRVAFRVPLGAPEMGALGTGGDVQ